MAASEATIRASAEAADGFVRAYYSAINDGKPVKHFYTTSADAYRRAGEPPADLCINGLVVSSPEEWDKMLLAQRYVPAPAGQRASTVRYDVESFDAHVINANYRVAAPAAALVPDPSKPDQGASARLMLMVSVSGTVRFGEDGDSLKQHFNDVFVLVPNWDGIARHGAKTNKRYLASSHTYRAY